MPPTLDELQALIEQTQWSPLGAGSFNTAQTSNTELTIGGYTGRWVLKKPKDALEYNEIGRAVRKWNLLNPEFPAYQTQKGWLVPYLGRIQASDKQIAEKLVEIYQRTGEIIADACVQHNFLVYQGKVVCVDVDYALRRGSFTSENFFHDDALIKDLLYCITNYADNHGKPNTARITQGLLYLEQQLPNYAKHQEITLRMAYWLYWFYEAKEPLTKELMETLFEVANLDAQGKIINVAPYPKLFKLLHEQKQHAPLTQDKLATLLKKQLWDPEWWAQSLNEEKVLEILRNDPSSMNRKGKYGYTFLHLATRYYKLKVLDYLVKHHADLEIRTDTNVELPYSDMTALDIAVQGQMVISKLLAKYGAKLPPELTALLPAKQESLNEAFICLWDNLHQLAAAPHELSEEKRSELLLLVTQHPQLLTWEVEINRMSILHCAFQRNNRLLIEAVTKLPNWNELALVKNFSGRTLWHVVANSNYPENIHFLNPTNLNTQTQYSQTAPLHIAAAQKNHRMCEDLLHLGANPCLQNQYGKTPEKLWPSEPNQPTPFSSLRDDFINTARKAAGLSAETRARITALVKQHTHFLLSWPIHNDRCFLELLFCEKHTELLQEFIQRPDWHELASQVQSPSLFYAIAQTGQLQYYDLLKHLPTTPAHWANTLRIATICGHAEFCIKLLEDGADPTHQTSTKNTAIEIWSSKHPDQPNPFMFHQLRVTLANKKERITTLLDKFVQSTAFFDISSGKAALQTLKQAIQQITTPKIDAPQKTADELIHDAVENWKANRPNLYPKEITEALAAITDLMTDVSEKHQTKRMKLGK